MQTQINPALAAAMTLERAAQAGQFQPVTPQGQPTVAAQLMQQAMPPSVPQVAQQAGLGAQIQAMQQQQAQQALMQQAMANRPPAGIEGLNPQMGNFAEGGIVGKTVGYAKAGKAEDKEPEEDGLLKYFLGIPAAVGALAGGQELAGAARNARELVNLARYGSLPAQAGTYAGAANPLAVTGLGGLAASGYATNILAANPELRAAYTREDTPLLGADPSGMALASAILEEGGRTAQAQRAAQEPRRRQAPALEDLPQADYSLEGRNYPRMLTALERYGNVQMPGGQGGGMGRGEAGRGEVGAPPARFTGAEAYRRKAEEAYQGVSTEPPTPSQVQVGAGEFSEARKAFLRGQGLDPEYIQKELEASGKRAQERAAYADKLRAELEERRGGVGAVPQGIIDFLLGARGIKGQGVGQIFTSGVGEMERAGAEARKESRQIQEMKFAYEDAATKERQLLESARHSIAMGDWNGAKADLAEAQKQRNAKQMAGADLYRHFSTDVSQEERERARLIAGASERTEARKAREQSGLQSLLMSADAKVAEVRKKAETILKENHLAAAMLYNQNPQRAMKDDPEGVAAYLATRKNLEDTLIKPAEADRDAIRNQLAGFSGWGNLTVSPSKK